MTILVGVLLLALLSVGGSSSPVWGWIMSGHQQIAQEAMTVLPPALQQLFETHRARVLDGSKSVTRRIER